MDREGSITAKATSIRLKPQETATIEVLFNQMEPCPLQFELNDWDSGSITPEGLYTAPNREGSFEIRILCATNHDINTYTYVNVEG